VSPRKESRTSGRPRTRSVRCGCDSCRAELREHRRGQTRRDDTAHDRAPNRTGRRGSRSVSHDVAASPSDQRVPMSRRRDREPHHRCAATGCSNLFSKHPRSGISVSRPAIRDVRELELGDAMDRSLRAGVDHGTAAAGGASQLLGNRAGPLRSFGIGPKRSEHLAQHVSEQAGFGGRWKVSTAVIL
jgi:hypothetical protein